MAEVKHYSAGAVRSESFDESVFGDRVLGRTLKDAVVMYLSNARAGTAKAKTRSEVAGPNKKLWKQKHTGRARMGTKKAVHWRGGGIAFGPLPRDHSYHMPRKARRVALRTAVLSKFRDGEVAVAEGWPAEAPSTKQAAGILRQLGMDRSALVVTAEQDQNLYLSLRNVPQVDVRPLADLNAHQVLLRRYMVLTPAAMTQLVERLGPDSAAATAAAEE
ncbi:MAG: 50S ribosomal protein L4 [Planctomycetota bacterium]